MRAQTLQVIVALVASLGQAAGAVTLATSIAPVAGIGGGNTVNQCHLLNVSATKAIKSVTISEYETQACADSGCSTSAKSTVTCTDLQPSAYCILTDNSTGVATPLWCRFTATGSSKNVRAGMLVFDASTGEAIAVVPATH